MTISNFAGELRRIVARTVQWQCKANVFDSDVWWHECGERVHRVHQAHGNVFILAQTMIFFFSFLFNAVIHIKNTLVNTITFADVPSVNIIIKTTFVLSPNSSLKIRGKCLICQILDCLRFWISLHFIVSFDKLDFEI